MGVFLWQNDIALSDTISAGTDFFRQLQAPFNAINYATPPVILFLPTVGFVALGYIIISVYHNPQAWFRNFVIAVMCLSSTIYICFRLFVTLNMTSFMGAFVSIAIVSIELSLYLSAMLGYYMLIRQTNRSQEADRASRRVTTGEFLPSVDIFITTYSESAEMLKRTIVGCQAIRYPRKTIYLLDDGNRQPIQLLAGLLGCQYIGRASNAGAKAGNLNNALHQTDGELIACFDADFVPTSDFLERLVGFFYDPAVGMIVTPQHFYNEEALTRNIGVGGIIPPEQTYFFRAVQPGRDVINSVVCSGTNYVMRRQNVMEHGGVPTDTLSEDYATSIQMQAQKTKTYYLNELLASGAAAENIIEFVQQRLRWASGTIQLLFSPLNPMIQKGLGWYQKAVFFSGLFYYFTFPLTVLITLAPLLYLFFGIMPFIATGNQILFFSFPYLIFNICFFSWTARLYTSSLFWRVSRSIMLWPMSINTVKTIIRPFGKSFRVTQKDLSHDSLTINYSVMLPILSLLIFNIAGLIYAVFNPLWPPQEYRWIYYFWTAYSVMIQAVAVQATIDMPQDGIAINHQNCLTGALELDGKSISVAIHSLSEKGCVLHLPDGECFFEKGDLSIPKLRMSHIPCIVNKQEFGYQVSVRFTELKLDDYRMLVKFLYCRPGKLRSITVSEGRAFIALIKIFFGFCSISEESVRKFT